MDDLEVIIENDGSSDATASIAASFVERFPGTFRLINKENGGYGSTVSRSVREASGKYFKILDGDDWFHTNRLRTSSANSRISMPTGS
jgi:glycosyltransferase involved in cell wall biosynthesis